MLDKLSEKGSPIEELLAHASTLEEQLKALQKLIESYSEALLNIKIAKQINDVLVQDHSENVIISGDRKANILLRGHLIKTNPLVHLGLNIYVEADHDIASKILDNKEKIISNQLERIKKEYEERLKEYKKLQDLLYSISQRSE